MGDATKGEKGEIPLESMSSVFSVRPLSGQRSLNYATGQTVRLWQIGR